MSKRPLTSGEIRLAQDLFADAIQYSAVRVYDRGFAFLNVIGDMSYAGHLYFPMRYRDDFSRTALAEQRLFIHELVHVWQYQHNVLNLALAALREGVKHRFQYRKAYLFRLEPGRDLLDYGMEQQAAIVEAYFLRRHGGVSMGRCLNEDEETPALLEGVLQNFLEDPSYPRRLGPAPALASETPGRLQPDAA
ncbi:hypothetical protein [Acidisoma sp. 7E03]